MGDGIRMNQESAVDRLEDERKANRTRRLEDATARHKARMEIMSLQAEVAGLKCDAVRLRAIVDKLPKTADGVPVVPGMKVYCQDPTGYIQGYDVGANSAMTDSSIPSPGYLQYNWFCYSTHEACEEAMSKARKQNE